MSRFAQPLQFIEVIFIIALVVLAWPTTVPCGAPYKTCTPPPNDKGEVIIPATIQPFAVTKFEAITHQDLPWAYKQTTLVDRPLLLDEEQPSATDSSSPTLLPDQ